jgi:hypothetical protein
MSDSHLRILRAVARQSRRQLESFGTASGAADTGSARRRLDLSERAARTKSRLAAAAARRRLISGRGTPAKADPGHK